MHAAWPIRFVATALNLPNGDLALTIDAAQATFRANAPHHTRGFHSSHLEMPSIEFERDVALVVLLLRFSRLRGERLNQTPALSA
jgi:hypothetical protein